LRVLADLLLKTTPAPLANSTDREVWGNWGRMTHLPDMMHGKSGRLDRRMVGLLSVDKVVAGS
jgi:hypothetical protein